MWEPSDSWGWAGREGVGGMIQKGPPPGDSGAASYTGVSKLLTLFHLIFLNIASPKANYGKQLPLPKLYIL